ncbi:N-acetyltransferase [Clostridium thailandense]|uniref:N-acetyltransferase n=1 Tax=Clostridium thailandense TaxID=2794346 RepID=UPI00398A0F1E
MIKQLEAFEIKEVMDIWLKTNVSAHNFMPREYWLENYKNVEEEYLPASTTFIYKENGVIKGFVSIIDNSFIGALFVHEDYQGQGVGEKLVNYCKSLYQGLRLGVYKENISAVNFYRNCGFITEKDQKNEDSGYEEYVMSWTK